MAVLRKLRLNWRSAIVLVGIPKWRRIHAPTPMLASDPPGTTIPTPSCAHTAWVAVRVPTTVGCQQTVRVHDPPRGLDVAGLREELERERADDPSPPADVLEAVQSLLEHGQKPEEQVSEDGVAHCL
jgi:hypothetical protein